MRRLAYSLAALGLLAAQQAQAQADMSCLTPPERGAVEVAALRSELMVLATGCHDDSDYNAFIHKYQPALVGNEADIGDMMKRKYGRRAQAEHDRFTTEMANAESDRGLRLGGDFCAHDGMLFTEVMALSSASDLAVYAAGKDLVPATLETCPTEVAQAPVRKTTRARVKHN
ncbi:MAG TPA: hypothetical protein VK726_04725 [Acetobacteraceae bacterium]|jgi:hypothetical protein|nr:hypothetical protein [Acetobacteraceae bacterium]